MRTSRWLLGSLALLGCGLSSFSGAGDGAGSSVVPANPGASGTLTAGAWDDSLNFPSQRSGVCAAARAGGRRPQRGRGQAEWTTSRPRPRAGFEVSTALNLLRPLLDALPQPIRGEADVDEKLTLE